MNQSKGQRVTSLTLRVTVAAILGQTLFFKFSGAPESVYIFKTMGMEPWGRIGSGIVELIAAMLLLAPQTVAIGAILALGVISGAIVSHLTRLGIAVQGDGGLLFALAVAVFLGSGVLLAIHRSRIPFAGPRLKAGHPAMR
jgi:putative oxidoreductase